MYTYAILTDSGSDLDPALIESLGVQVAPLVVNFKGGEYTNDQLDNSDFYRALREGELASTSAVNPEGWAALLRPVLESGLDALVLAFSSGLSTTAQSAVIAAEELAAEFPARKIRVVDTLCASLGEGLLVYTCAKLREQGKTLDEVADFAQQNLLKLCHWFTVDDLHFLKRGGRVSATTAVIGSLLSIKPVMHVDDAGKLIKVDTARGRKASIEALLKKMKQSILEPEKQTVFISHGDCLEDAEYLARRIREELPVVDVVIGYVGPVIGSHSGPGTLALFFYGSVR